MKYSYLSLTFLIAFLPALLPTFNTFGTIGKNETLSKDHLHQDAHQHHGACFFQHKTFLNIRASEQIAFGAELGQHIREAINADADYKVKTVVIDPGHGGKDPGCSGTGTKEKNIALSIAMKLGRTLEAYFPEVKFIYTRKSDVFVPLDRRAKIANENNADLFISIHCNNFPKSASVKGSETYVLGLHRAEDNLEVAKRENSAIFYEDNYQETYGGYDPNSPEGHIILSMYQNAFLEQSILFANKIEDNIQKNTRHKSRGVRQAGFLVLRETTMPSVLVEAGYLSNTRDNRYLATKEGQQQIVNSIAQAFSAYKKEVEGGQAIYIPDNYVATVEDRFTKKSTPKVTKAPALPSKKVIKSPSRTVTQAKPVPSGKAQSGNIKLSKQSLIVPTKNPDHHPTTGASTGIQYKVLLTSTSGLINTNVSPWTKVPYTVQVIQEGDLYKYLAIGFDNFERAVSAKSELRQLGFNEAFLVAYQNGKRIDIKVAKAMTGIR